MKTETNKTTIIQTGRKERLLIAHVSGRSELFVFEVKGADVKGLKYAKNDVALFTKNNLIKGVANSNNVCIFDISNSNKLN